MLRQGTEAVSPTHDNLLLGAVLGQRGHVHIGGVIRRGALWETEAASGLPPFSSLPADWREDCSGACRTSPAAANPPPPPASLPHCSVQRV